jgi:hypothetical protein
LLSPESIAHNGTPNGPSVQSPCSQNHLRFDLISDRRAPQRLRRRIGMAMQTAFVSLGKIPA